MCGLKSLSLCYDVLVAFVTSFTDVWIEISATDNSRLSGIVTSFTDVWIEMSLESSPVILHLVTSFTDVCIEIL